MSETTVVSGAGLTIGLDIGDRTSEVCVLDGEGAVLASSPITDPDVIASILRHLGLPTRPPPVAPARPPPATALPFR